MVRPRSTARKPSSATRTGSDASSPTGSRKGRSRSGARARRPDRRVSPRRLPPDREALVRDDGIRPELTESLDLGAGEAVHLCVEERQENRIADEGLFDLAVDR